MPDYKKLCLQLLDAAADALNEMDRFNYGRAAELLKSALRDTEEQCARDKD